MRVLLEPRPTCPQAFHASFPPTCSEASPSRRCDMQRQISCFQPALRRTFETCLGLCGLQQRADSDSQDR